MRNAKKRKRHTFLMPAELRLAAMQTRTAIHDFYCMLAKIEGGTSLKPHWFLTHKILPYCRPKVKINGGGLGTRLLSLCTFQLHAVRF